MGAALSESNVAVVLFVLGNSEVPGGGFGLPPRTLETRGYQPTRQDLICFSSINRTNSEILCNFSNSAVRNLIPKRISTATIKLM